MDVEDKMEYLAYGETGLEISRLCFGAGHLNNTLRKLRSWRQTDVEGS